MVKRLLPFLLIFSAIGCTKNMPATIALREAMDGSSKTIREEHLQWTAEKHTAGQLTDAQYNNRVAAHKAYQDVVDKSRAGD